MVIDPANAAQMTQNRSHHSLAASPTRTGAHAAARGADGCGQLVDVRDGAALLFEIYKEETLPDPASTDNTEYQIKKLTTNDEKCHQKTCRHHPLHTNIDVDAQYSGPR